MNLHGFLFKRGTVGATTLEPEMIAVSKISQRRDLHVEQNHVYGC